MNMESTGKPASINENSDSGNGNDGAILAIDNEPLETLKLEVDQDGRKKLVAAFHIGWAVKRTFAHYYPPPAMHVSHVYSEQTLDTIQEMWVERMEMLKQDLMFLLKLSHHRFWSQVVYHEGTHGAFESYLVNAPRFHDFQAMVLTKSMRDIQNEIHRCIFLVYLRMSTFKESKSCHISPATFGVILYDYFIFDIPKIMDLCALFRHNNKKLLQKMINNVFACQPKYMDDLRKAVKKIYCVFSTIVEKFGLKFDEFPEDIRRARKLSPPQQNMPWSHMLDVFYFFVDTCISVYSLLDVYPAACQTFFSQKFLARLSSFYSIMIPFLKNEFNRRKMHPEIAMMITNVLSRFSLARDCLLKSFRQIIEVCCVQPMLEKGSVMDSGSYIDMYLEIMTGILSDKSFLVDYERRHPFTEDVDLFIQMGLFLDNNRISYINKGIHLLMKESSLELSSSSCTTTFSMSDWDASNGHEIGIVQGGVMNSEDSFTGLDGACANLADIPFEMDTLIHQIKELLPDCQNDFIQACLKHYNYNAEQVINAILETSLPDELQKLNFSRAEVVDNRTNIFDNDEFDVFTNDRMDLSRIHMGKWRHRNKLDSCEEDVKRVTLLLSTKCELDMSGDGNESLYEDEYDDTYDEQMIGVSESVPWDEVLERRPFVTPNILRNSSVFKAEHSPTFEEESKEENVDQRIERPKRDEFISDPAVEREKEKQRRKDVFQQCDVKGRPKGKGQDVHVTRNRESKERNKIFHGNHNRKNMADRKRSNGMFPT